MKTKLKSILAIALCAVGLAAAAGLVPVEYLDWDDVGKEMTNAVCTAYAVVTADMTAFDAGKTYVVMDDVSVSSRITVEGTVANPTRLILCDGTKLTASAGVKVTVSGATTNALVICGQTLGTGALEATGGLRTAGIGGLSNDTPGESGTGGTVTINGGTVTATGGNCGAGIGGGWGGHGGTVTINGGTVTAKGVQYGAGIGGGLYGAGGNVSINGGTVTATAGTDGGEAPTVAIGCCQQSGDNGTVAFGAGKWIVKQGDVAPGTDTTAEAYAADHSAKYVHIEPPPPEISAVSAEGFLDLTVGDRIAKDVETIVVDPAWDETDPTLAKVQIDGEDEPRQYTVATNDTWETAALEPGRYELEMQTSCSSYPAGFWKVGADWVVFDSSNITADVTFEAGKTYLVLGTNMVNGATLTVEDGAKFFYDEGAPAGFKAASVAELPKRYEIADGVDPADENNLFQIVEKPRGSEDNPWDIGEGVTAYTNGTELVIGGEGTVADLSEISDEVKGEVESLTIATNGVTGVASEAFQGFGDFGLTLPDGWQGELPDDDGNWYGARNVSLLAYPLTVKNVKFLQRYPWNGKVDIGFDVTGSEGEKTAIVTVRDGATEVTNFTSAVTIDESCVLATNLVWDATTAGLAADFKSDAVTVEVALVENAPNGPVQLWENGPYFAACNVGANAPQEYGYYFWWGDTTGYVRNGSSWDAADESKTGFSFASENCPTYGKTIEQLYNDGNGYIDANSADGKLKPAYDAATAHLGAPWRMMTKDELELLTNTAYCVSVWTDDYNETGVAGQIVTGVTEGYTDKSIFLPAAGVGANLAFNGANMLGFFWASTPSSDNSDCACALNLVLGDFEASRCSRGVGASVRAVRDTPPEVAPAAPAISAKSAAGTVDLRTNVALAEGETTISNVTWSATLWGELDEEFVTAIGWTNLTTGATGVFSNLARVVGDAAEDVDLPKKDGEYVLTHSTGDLTSFVTFVVSGYPLGSEGNPWLVGAGEDPDGVVAWTNVEGVVIFKPSRSAVSREGLETVTNAMGGASFLVKLISEDGSATNDLVMVLGESGTVYDTIAEALYADETSYTLFDVDGYLVSYDGGEGASGTMATDKFIPTVPTNLTANAYTIVGYAFTGWSTDGVNKAYDDCAAGVDFVQPGETLSLTALWEQVETVPANYDDLTNMLAKVTRPVTITLDEDIEIPAGGMITVPAGKSVNFAGIGKFDVSAESPALFCGYPVGTGLKPEDLDRFKTDKDVKTYFEDGKVVVRGRGETEDFPWLIGTDGHEDEVTAWAGDGMILVKPARGTASVAALQSVTNALSGYVPGPGELKVISADGSATNDVVALVGDDGMLYDTLADVFAADPMPTTVRLYEVPGQTISLPAGIAGQTLVVSNLTTGAEITPSSSMPGGAEYVLPLGAKVAIYVVPSDGYRLLDDGTNPIVIDEVTPETTVDASAFPTVKSLAEASPIGDSDTTWRIEDGVLYIEGSGEMPDFTDDEEAPWNEFTDEITSVEIGDEVTKLGDLAFGSCDNVAEVVLASDATPVNPAAFSADGETVENEPKLFVRNAEGGLDEVLEYRDPDDDTTVYDTLEDALDDGAEAVEVVTLPKEKAEAIAALTDCAGEDPSEAVQKILAEAIAAIEAAETISDVDSAARVGYNDILTQIRKEKPQPIGDSDTTWRIENGVLYIEGSGDMPDFTDDEEAPWNEFADEITAISVGEAVEHLGNAAFSACNGATAITLANEEGVVNLAAFVSPDGSETNFPADILVVEDGESAPAVRFEGDAEEDYDSLAAAYAAGETDVSPLTLNNLKAGYVEGLEELAGPEPRSEEMQKLLDEAVEAVLAATTPEELDAAAEKAGLPIYAQAAKEAVEKAAGDPAKRSKELQAVVDEALAAIAAATTFEEVGAARAAALAAIAEILGKAGELYPDGDGGVFVAPDKATAYEGVVLDASGEVAGTITVKLSKPTKKGVMRITAKVKTLVDRKTWSFKLKDVPTAVNGPLAVALEPSNKRSAVHSLAVVIEGDSLTGVFDDGEIDAARNVFKRKGDPKRDAVLPLVGVWTGAFACDAGDIYFSVAMKKTGSARVRVRLPNGKFVSSTVKAEVGDGIVAVPAVIRKSAMGVVTTFGYRLAFTAGEDGAVELGVINATAFETRDRSGTVKSSDAVELFAAGAQTVTSAEFKAFLVTVDPELEKALGPITKNGLRLSASSGWISGSLKFGKVSGKASGVVTGGTGIGKVNVKVNGEKRDYPFLATPVANPLPVHPIIVGARRRGTIMTP